jgi:hypothetical protein
MTEKFLAVPIENSIEKPTRANLFPSAEPADEIKRLRSQVAELLPDALRFRAMAAEWDAYVQDGDQFTGFQLWTALGREICEEGNDGNVMRSIIDSFERSSLPIGATRQ